MMEPVYRSANSGAITERGGFHGRNFDTTPKSGRKVRPSSGKGIRDASKK